MTPDELHAAIDAGTIDTVVMAFPDHYGRLMGKRFDGRFFLDAGLDGGTHACDYLFTADMEMEPVEGYAYSNWQRGYGDFHMVPDLATLRPCGWTERAAIVMCDAHDNTTHEPVAIAPRSILAVQTAAAAELGVVAMGASELEFFIFRETFRDAHAKGYRDLEAAGWYVEDYHLFQGARVEGYVGAARRMLDRSGIPVESSKGEAAVGQHELNVRYTDVLGMADRHSIMKEAMKELAEAQGISVSFMAKPDATQPGSSCHLHLSLWRDGTSAFCDASGAPTDAFRWFLGGWMQHVPHLMPMYAPTINSYKRFRNQSWAPTGVSWSHDNRTTGFRIVGTGQSMRIECRLPGADTNPYLAFAAALASGLDGIRNEIEPPPEHVGDGYSGDGYSGDGAALPPTLAAATAAFVESADARRLFGDAVVDHYGHFFASECAAYDAAVTDWERRRYFERI